MRSSLSDGLDLVDEMDVDTGFLDLAIVGRGVGGSGILGVTVETGHRLSDNWSALATGEAGYYYGDLSGLGYQFGLGLRKRWK